MNALLAISAVHLFSFTPTDHALMFASRMYFNKALSQHRDSLGSLNARNAEQSLIAALLIAHFSWLVSHAIGPKQYYALALEAYHMCKGIHALTSKKDLQLDKYNWRSSVRLNCPQQFLPTTAFLGMALEDMAVLEKCFDRAGGNPEDAKVYELAAEEIVAIYFLAENLALSDVTIEQEIITLLHRLPLGFIQLLEKRDPVAMALFARNIAVLEVINESDTWWIHGAGERRTGITAVQGIRRLMPREWLWTMDWPLKVISKEVKLVG